MPRDGWRRGKSMVLLERWKYCGEKEEEMKEKGKRIKEMEMEKGTMMEKKEKEMGVKEMKK